MTHTKAVEGTMYINSKRSWQALPARADGGLLWTWALRYISYAIRAVDGFVPMCLEVRMEHTWCWPQKSAHELCSIYGRKRIFLTLLFMQLTKLGFLFITKWLWLQLRSFKELNLIKTFHFDWPDAISVSVSLHRLFSADTRLAVVHALVLSGLCLAGTSCPLVSRG